MGFINSAERAEIEGLMNFLDECKENSANSTVIIDGVTARITAWQRANHNIDEGEGIVSGYCLYIAYSSANLWASYRANDETFEDVTPSGIAPWVAADAAGALGGAIGAALDSYSNTGSINWNSVGSWAVGGAVGASAVGPIGKFLSWLF